ncbi:MAG: hypothetical protein JWO77_2673 [Ilumatobacteraceae bacterium]|nr:hypothetical protein [Ilumatobacteraceae bacterium]
MVPSSIRSLAVGAALATVLVGTLAGCGKDEFEDKTAVVRVGGSSQTYSVDSCGLDKQTVFVVARADDGAIVQGVMGLEDDDKTGVPASTGITIDLDPSSEDTRVAAFGVESWERRGSNGKAPGTIAAAKLRGSRIQFSGDVVPVDANDVPIPDGEPQRFSLDARCDQVEE